jgi:hypothetical protein
MGQVKSTISEEISEMDCNCCSCYSLKKRINMTNININACFGNIVICCDKQQEYEEERDISMQNFNNVEIIGKTAELHNSDSKLNSNDSIKNITTKTITTKTITTKTIITNNKFISEVESKTSSNDNINETESTSNIIEKEIINSDPQCEKNESYLNQENNKNDDNNIDQNLVKSFSSMRSTSTTAVVDLEISEHNQKDNKSDNNKNCEDNKSEDNKFEDDKSEDNKFEDDKSEDNKSEDNKSEDNKSDVKSEDKISIATSTMLDAEKKSILSVSDIINLPDKSLDKNITEETKTFLTSSPDPADIVLSKSGNSDIERSDILESENKILSLNKMTNDSLESMSDTISDIHLDLDLFTEENLIIENVDRVNEVSKRIFENLKVIRKIKVGDKLCVTVNGVLSIDQSYIPSVSRTLTGNNKNNTIEQVIETISLAKDYKLKVKEIKKLMDNKLKNGLTNLASTYYNNEELNQKIKILINLLDEI